MHKYNNETPFIHLLRSRRGYYFYDVNMNEIVNVSGETYNYLSSLEKKEGQYSTLVSPSVDAEVNCLVNKGYLKTNRPRIIEMPGMQNLEYSLSNKLKFLILQVTQKCNFRCKYCHFSTDEEGYHEHNYASMDWETARKAIDFFAERTRDQRNISIVFYGGEPLLELELLYKCIEYCNRKFFGKKLNYFLTTNAELLTIENAKFLLENNVSITVSIDGPKEIHDKNRKRAGDGSGTFDKIYDNLRRIKCALPNHYKKIKFNCVIDPASDCKCIDEFFSSNMFKDSYVATNLMSPADTKKLYLSKEYIKNEKKSKLLFLLARANIYRESQITTTARNFFDNFYMFESRFDTLGKIPNTSGHAGPCKPGVNKLFVSVSGKFYICEKARDDSNALCIGSLEYGFDIQKIKEICSYMCRDRCKNCWNIHNCNVCQMMLDDGEKLSDELFDIACENSCRIAEENFKKLVAVSEFSEIIHAKECQEKHAESSSIPL